MRQGAEGPATRVTEEVALAAARQFAAVVAETPEYLGFEAAQQRLRQDPAAREAIRTFEARQQNLSWMLRFGAAGEAERAELQRLKQAMLAQPTVRAFVEAQDLLGSLCRESAQLISEEIGMSFAAACGPGCC